MSDKAVKTDKPVKIAAGKKKGLKLFKWALFFLFAVIIGAAVIFCAVIIVEKRQIQQHKDFSALTQQVLQNRQALDELRNLPAAIAQNTQRIAENTGDLKLYNENFAALKEEVGNRKFDILAQQFTMLNHRIESLEEAQSPEIITLIVALFIKENALYNRSFTAEANILQQLSREQEDLAPAVQAILNMRGKTFSTDTQLADEYVKIAQTFSFEKPDAASSANDRKSAISKSIDMIKDTVAGMNFDKIVVLKKDKRTNEQKALTAQAETLVKSFRFKEAIALIRGNSEFQKVHSPALVAWIEQVEQKIAFEEALSFIITTELNAIRQDFRTRISDSSPTEPTL